MASQLFISLLFILLLSTTAKGQDSTATKKPPKWDADLEGMLGFSVGEDFYAFNVGGPSFSLVLNHNWKIGVGALPSFYVLKGKTGAKLGVSPRIDYKNWVFIAPFYHRISSVEWVWSIGFGYKFHNKK